MAYAQLSYDPWEALPEERRARFVGRENLLQQILSAIDEQQDHNTLQHYLLLGPRGIGKTNLLLTLRDRVRESPTLSPRWFCIQFREEEYSVATLRDLLERVLDALAEEENLPEAADLRERVRQEGQHERSIAIAMDGLRALASSHGRRVLLLIDNFDRIFPATASGRRKNHSPDNEFRSLRKVLSTESFLMVVGASVRLFEEIAAYDRAFFNFFCPVEIPNLDHDEICELLRKCAAIEGNDAFLAQFDLMRDKVRAITYMTGGNPRLVLMLYDVLRRGQMVPVVQALRETVFGLTPLLKHVLDDMPRQQSKTLDALVRLRGAASPTEIARMARLPLNVVTVQLGRLKEGRFVTGEGEGRGSPATYRISDPMFHTWYQTRYLRPSGRRIELFVEFIRAWFSVEQRRELLEERWRDFKSNADRTLNEHVHHEASLSIQYYAAALEDERERQDHFGRLADAFVQGGRKRDAAILLAESAEPFRLTETHFESAGYRLLGDRMLSKGSINEATMAFDEALRKEPGNAAAALGLGVCLGMNNEHAKAVLEFERVIDTPGVSAKQVASALFFRGLAKMILSDAHGAIADYTAVLEQPGISAEQVNAALLNRAFAKSVLGDSLGAIIDYTSVVDWHGTPAEHVAGALFNRAVAKAALGDTKGGIADYTALVDLPGAPAAHVAGALFNRAVAKAALGDSQGAICDYTVVVDLAGAPKEAIARALFNRAAAKTALGDSQGAIIDYTSVVDWHGAPAEQVAGALFNRAVAKAALGDSQGAICDYTAVVDLAGAPKEAVARALFNRAAAKAALGDSQGAIADYTTLVDLPGARAEHVASALVERGLAKNALGHSQGAIADYTAAIDLFGSPVEQTARALINRGAIKSAMGDIQGAIADSTAAIDLPDVPIEGVARALVNRSQLKGFGGDMQGAIADCTTVLNLPNPPLEQLAEALSHRALAKASIGDIQGVIADCTAVLNMAGAPPELTARALVNRGNAKSTLSDSQGAIADFTAAAYLPGAPVEQVAMALFNRGCAKGTLSLGAIADYAAVVNLTGASDERVAQALVNSGIVKTALGDSQGAIADYTAVVDLPGAPVDQIAKALLNRGLAFGMARSHDAALSDFQSVLSLPNISVGQRAFALIKSGIALTMLGRPAEALTCLEQCLALRASAASVHGAFVQLVLNHLRGARPEDAVNCMSRLHEFEPLETSLEQSLETRISVILTAGKEYGPETAGLLLDAALKSDPEETRVRMAFLVPAIEYAKTGEEEAVSRLPERERHVARQIASAIAGHS